MRHVASAVMLIALTAAPAAAQGRGRSGGIPPGHLPPPGECRVWYDGVPPGQQPPPTSCAEAHRMASRSRDARVIYGDDARYDGGGKKDKRDKKKDRDRIGRRDDRVILDGRRPRPDDDRDVRDRGRAVPRSDRYPTGSYPGTQYPGRRGDARTGAAGYQNGYRDGLVKGREDIGDGDSFDPNRHAWYRSADRGYNSRTGSREEYRADYRTGFLAGYDDAYRGRRTEGTRSRPWYWPF